MPGTALMVQFLSIESLAEMFDTTPATVRRWEKAGVIPPATVIGGLRRWEQAAVLRWVGDRLDGGKGRSGRSADPDAILEGLDLEAREEGSQEARRRHRARISVRA